jgi:conjugative transfer signal peptidase TraF
MKFDPAPLRKAILVLLCLLAFQVLTGFWGKPFWVNFTDSVPAGLYRIEKLSREVKRGDLIIMDVPPQFRRYTYGRKWLPDRWTLFKYAGAVPGDLFCVRGASFTVNGFYVGPVLPVDQEGLPLPHLEGCWQVPAGHFLPVATGILHSFDGRYMGTVSLSEVRGLARPIWVF